VASTLKKGPKKASTSRDSAGQAHPVDQHVGAQVRLRRRMLGVSQEKLADQLDLTFQQVQKYERGHNRISASKLFQIAQALETDISQFFRGLATGGEDGEIRVHRDAVSEFLATPDGLELVQLWGQVPPRSRRKLIGLIRVMAGGED